MPQVRCPYCDKWIDSKDVDSLESECYGEGDTTDYQCVCRLCGKVISK